MSWFRRIGFLIIIFLLSFLAVFYVRNGTLPFIADKGSSGFRPEQYNLADKQVIDQSEIANLTQLDADRTKLVQTVLKSVVSITTEGVQKRRYQYFGRIFEKSYEVSGVGSGVVVSKQGHIITNHHVIEGKSELIINTHDGDELRAKVVGSDKDLDIAVLKIDSNREFSPLPFGNSDEVLVGQSVFALGNPFGLGETVTRGIISAKERSFSETHRGLFQTDAAINPGNSGGPLINIRGEIIGINVAIFSPNKDANMAGSVGVGFSIPSNDVKRAFLQIADKGRVVKGYLGVTPVDIKKSLRKDLNYTGEGVFIYDVRTGSPAYKAGLQKNDVIIKYDGVKVKDRGQLIGLISQSKVGEEVTIDVWREGENYALKPILIDGYRKDEQLTKTQLQEAKLLTQEIGFNIRTLTPQETLRGFEGVAVTGVQRGSIAQKVRLQPRDLIISLNNKRISHSMAFYAALHEETLNKRNLILIVDRMGQQIQVRL